MCYLSLEDTASPTLEPTSPPTLNPTLDPTSSPTPPPSPAPTAMAPAYRMVYAPLEGKTCSSTTKIARVGASVSNTTDVSLSASTTAGITAEPVLDCFDECFHTTDCRYFNYRPSSGKCELFGTCSVHEKVAVADGTTTYEMKEHAGGCAKLQPNSWCGDLRSGGFLILHPPMTSERSCMTACEAVAEDEGTLCCLQALGLQKLQLSHLASTMVLLGGQSMVQF